MNKTWFIYETVLRPWLEGRKHAVVSLNGGVGGRG
jgi:hypothetical protein